MVWLLPAAFAGLLALGGPLLVHLLRRQRARTLRVPTVRFIPALDQSIVRIRTPADGWLLLLRMAIVACAALALARPLLLTEARAAGWREAIARVVVVDVSESSGAAAAAEAADVELQSADVAHRIGAIDLAPALRRAAAWLESAPPARREIVVLSDFQRGVLEAADVDAVRKEVGMRFIPVRPPAPTARREIIAGPVLAENGVLQRTVRLDASTTSATFTPVSDAIDGLRLLTVPDDPEAAASLLRVIARAGAHAPSASEPIVIRFPGSLPPEGGSHQLREGRSLLPEGGTHQLGGGVGPQAEGADQETRAGAPTPPGASGGFRLQAEERAKGWTREAAPRLLREADRNHLPLSVAPDAAALVVDVNAEPGSLAAAEVVKAALDARLDPRALAEQEIARIPEATLSAWTREPGAADTTAWRRSDESDGRWFWLAALVLLGLETFVRRSRAAAAQEVDVRAA